MSSRQKSLVIVESPAKAKTINRFLGSSYTVKASMGHVRDLPAAKLGVDVDGGFKPHYVVISGKKKVVSALKAAAAKAENVYLAPDMDREGEAIAWHLANVIGKEQAHVRRVIFNEITEKAIKDAFKNPIEIDLHKVDAQQARRVLDRLVGYLVSPLLWKVVHRRTSAGRVQSVALRLVCEREEEIARFVPKEYWTIEAEFRSPRGEPVRASLDKIGKVKAGLDTETEATRVRDDIMSQTFTVLAVDKKEKRRNPRPPYITSTLQQDGARRIGFGARKTMSIAQALYEGIDLGEEGPVGLITYMRTDSIRVAADACDQARGFITSTYGDQYIPRTATKFRKPKSSQDAHEAIRPTDVARTPESLAKFLTRDQARLYKLVWERFVASQMAQAVFDVTTVGIEGGPYTFKASGSVMRFDGFLKVHGEKAEDEEKRLPQLEVGDRLALEKVDANRHETEHPPRYTESSLIKELEDKGIGRPSTYATIVSTIVDRRYVDKTKDALMPTELGKTVLSILLKLFPDIFEVGFTARMETELDRIESGQDDWVKVISGFYEPFSKDLASADKMRQELKIAVEEKVDQQCELCGRSMVKKWGRHGRFLACSGFPECKNTKPLEEEAETTDARCPDCGGEMIVRTGRYGKFLACKAYPACKGTKRYTLGIGCPECGGELAEKRTKRGRIFYGCQGYPKCKFATWDKPVSHKCPDCGFPIMVSKGSGEKGTRLECPKCKGGAEK
ncbi:MAG: type I DNA topoisomerase [bacterium]